MPRSPSATPDCRYPTPKRRPNWAGPPFPEPDSPPALRAGGPTACEGSAPTTRLVPRRLIVVRLFPREVGRSLLERRLQPLGQILRRQERRIPRRDVAQALRDPGDALLIEHVLDAVDDQRRVGGDLGGRRVCGRK